MTLAAGQILQNRYRIVSLLAQGGMGAVYRAWHTRLDIPVALKEMIPQPGLGARKLDQLHRQFQREAQTLARLTHANLVRVIDFFQERDKVYLIMDYVQGESLADRIRRKGALSESEVLTWADQLLDALVYCHDQGIIHRDVKPQNVIIRPDGQAILVDFGLVKLWDPTDPRTRTAIRAMGTPQYAPPEQYDLTGHTDARSDIYSLGATLYHALTGQAPPTATQRSASDEAFKPPRALNRRISSETEEAVLRAMELRVRDRFQSAQDMRSALGRVSEGSTVVTGAITSRQAAPAAPSRLTEADQGLSLALLAGVAAGGLILGAALLVGFFSGPRFLWGGGKGTPQATTAPVVPTDALPSPSPMPQPTATLASSGQVSTPLPTAATAPVGEPTVTPVVRFEDVRPPDGATFDPGASVTFRWGTAGAVPPASFFLLKTNLPGCEEISLGDKREQTCALPQSEGVYEWWVELRSGDRRITGSELRTLQVRWPVLTSTPRPTLTPIPPTETEPPPLIDTLPPPTDTEAPPPTDTEPPPPTDTPIVP
jgi:serine/threonine-protein kinase